MFGKKTVKEEEKLHRPQTIPGPVQKHLVADWKLPADLVPLLKCVLRRSAGAEGGCEIRVFDESDALARKLTVNDYNTLTQHLDMVLYEGTYDEHAKTASLREIKKLVWDVPILTEAQIMAEIEKLSKPGDSVFFYIAAGASHGGPLGMGSVVVALNDQAVKKQKKYSISFADVVDLKPVDKGSKLYDSDKAKEIAKWVAQGHHRRTY